MSYVLGFAILFMLLTGGTLFHFGGTKIEASSLDLWVMALGILLWIEKKATGRSALLSALEPRAEKLLSSPLRSRKWAAGSLILVFGALALAHILRHWALETNAFDLTFLHQSIRHLLASPPLRCDLCLGGSYFGEHLSFSLFLLLPLQWLSPVMPPWIFDFGIFGFQAALLGMPVWWVIKHGPLRDRRELWFVAVAAILCHRSLRNATVWDFREDDLAFASLLLASLGLLRGKLVMYWGFLFLALLSKENIPFITPFLAGPILLDPSLPINQRSRRITAALTLAISLIWGWVAFRILIPHFNAGTIASSNIVSRLGEFGASPSEILVNLLTSPSAGWKLLSHQLLTREGFKYLLLLLGPYLFWIWRGRTWSWLLPAVPGIAMNLLSSAGTQRSLEFHYDLVILPFLMVGLLIGIQKSLSPRIAVIGLLVGLAFSGRWPGWQIQKYWPDRGRIQDAFYLAAIPRDLAIATSLRPMAHLSHIEKLRMLGLPSPANPGSERSWEQLQNANREDRTQIPHHSAREADHLLLDLQQESWHRWIFKMIHKSPNPNGLGGWTEISRSPSGRFVLIRANGR